MDMPHKPFRNFSDDQVLFLGEALMSRMIHALIPAEAEGLDDCLPYGGGHELFYSLMARRESVTDLLGDLFSEVADRFSPCEESEGGTHDFRVADGDFSEVTCLHCNRELYEVVVDILGQETDAVLDEVEWDDSECCGDHCDCEDDDLG
jgi:hypothetical protein